MKTLTKQSKKNLKHRAKKIFEQIRLKSGFPLAMEYTGSFAVKGPMTQREDGSYDLDINIKSKFIKKGSNAISSAATVSIIMNKIIKETTRSNEFKIQKKRVIFLGNETDGFKYNLDISFKLIENGKINKTLVFMDGKYAWR